MRQKKDPVTPPDRDTTPGAAADWARENAEAIAERRAWVQQNGTPLADLQVLKIS